MGRDAVVAAQPFDQVLRGETVGFTGRLVQYDGDIARENEIGAFQANLPGIRDNADTRLPERRLPGAGGSRAVQSCEEEQSYTLHHETPSIVAAVESGDYGRAFAASILPPLSRMIRRPPRPTSFSRRGRAAADATR